MTGDEPAPRLAPLPREQWDDDVRAALRMAFPDAVVQRFVSTEPDAPPAPNVLATMVHHPALAGPWLVYNNVLLTNPALGHRMRELIVLRVAWRTQSRYEWAHVRFADRFDITADDIDALSRERAAVAWTPDRRARSSQPPGSLQSPTIASTTTWQQLAEHLDEKQLVEVVFVAGSYVPLDGLPAPPRFQLDPGTETELPPLPG